MKDDRYLRFVLTLIAFALLLDVGAKLVPIRTAFADQTMKCEITHPVKIEGEIKVDTFSKPVRVEVTDEVEVKTVR